MLVARPATIPPAFLIQRKPLSFHGTFAVYSKMRRRRRPSPQIQYEEEDQTEEVGDVGFSILAALKSDSTPKSISPLEPRPSEVSAIEEDKEKKRGASLRGSDVLFALQKAAAKKANSSSKGRKGVKGKPGTEGRADDGLGDLSDVRPIQIRSDWGVRLDEMEKKLEELVKEVEQSA